MIINSQPPISPALNREPIRTQSSADSSPESSVVQDQKTAPVPDVRVVQQTNEIANSHALKEPKLDLEQEAKAQLLDGEEKQAAPGQEKINSQVTLTEGEQRQVQQLADRDREVRAHEQAHLSAAGSRATSGASFNYTDGPDGRRYATGGEVRIDTSTVQGDPAATVRAAEQIQRAALAPAEPSAQDRQVAAAANAMAQVASVELSQQRAEEGREESSVEQSLASVGHSREALDSAPVAVTSNVSGEAASEVVVDNRNAQTQNRQQQLEEAYSVVQQRRDNNEYAQNPGNVISSGVQQNAAQAPAVDVSVQSRQGGAEVSAVAQDVRVAAAPVSVGEGDLAPAVETSQVASVEVVRSAGPATTETDVVRESVVDTRDEQVKNRQSQLEGAFNSVAQGLGGEPRGTNLDYFL